MINFSAKPQYKTVWQFIALVLCFWMSGVICAVSCCPAEMTVLATAKQEASNSVQTNDSCPMRKQAAERTGENSVANSSSFVPPTQNTPRLECCPLMNLLSSAGRTTRHSEAPVFISSSPVKFNFSANEQQKSAFQKNFRTVPRTLSQIYLRNCVFLI